MVKAPIRARAAKPLLPADRAEPRPIAFDRRRAAREDAAGAVMASFVSPGTGITLARVEFRDASRGGAGLRCPVAVEAGARFSLYREGAALARDRGRVARCTSAGDGFILGLRFDAGSGIAA